MCVRPKFKSGTDIYTALKQCQYEDCRVQFWGCKAVKADPQADPWRKERKRKRELDDERKWQMEMRAATLIQARHRGNVTRALGVVRARARLSRAVQTRLDGPAGLRTHLR